MLYMVEMELPERSQLAEWNQWYDRHLQLLLSVPGFLSAQRFEATTPTASPFVALYAIARADVITSPEYRAKAGPESTGRWRSLMTNWRRNILDGLELVPEVPMGGWLAIFDRHADVAPRLPEGYASLRPVGLDRSMLERGLRFGGAAEAPPRPMEDEHCTLRVCRPLTALLKPGAAPAGAR